VRRIDEREHAHPLHRRLRHRDQRPDLRVESGVIVVRGLAVRTGADGEAALFRVPADAAVQRRAQYRDRPRAIFGRPEDALARELHRAVAEARTARVPGVNRPAVPMSLMKSFLSSGRVCSEHRSAR